MLRLLGGLLLLLITGCGDWNQVAADKYGMKFNAVRRAHGVPVLPSDWFGYRSHGTNVLVWKSPKTAIPLWDEKVVILDGTGAIESETDRYLTGRKVSARDPDYKGIPIDEEISIRYFYSNGLPVKVQYYVTDRAGVPKDECLGLLKSLGIEVGEFVRQP